MTSPGRPSSPDPYPLAITPPALAGLLAGAPGEDVAARWDRAPCSARRETLRLLFTSITVAKGRPGEVTERVGIEWS